MSAGPSSIISIPRHLVGPLQSRQPHLIGPSCIDTVNIQHSNWIVFRNDSTVNGYMLYHVATRRLFHGIMKSCSIFTKLQLIHYVPTYSFQLHKISVSDDTVLIKCDVPSYGSLPGGPVLLKAHKRPMYNMWSVIY